MHGVVVNVTINDSEAATASLRDEIVPRASQAPGFVAGYWLRKGDSGMSVMVLESEEAANALAEIISGAAPGDAVTFESIEVREVVANA